MGDAIVVEREDGVGRVWLNRPDRRNALTPDMWSRLAETFRALGADDTVRVIVLSGVGDSFCSGHDLGATERSDSGRPTKPQILHMRAVTDTVLSLYRVPQPTVARVVGPVAGGGCGLALACDLVVAAESARFVLAFLQRGLVPDCGASWFLPRRVGMSRAVELLLTGDTLGAQEASAVGLVNMVVPDADIDKEVAQLTKRLRDGPPVAAALTKALLARSFSLTLEEALEAEATSQSAAWATADRREAFAAFAERRPPRFQGR